MLYGSVCRLQEDSIEKQLTRWQLAIKGFSSNNWFMDIRKILVRYDLLSSWDLLDNPAKKQHWRIMFNKQVNGYWSAAIRQSTEVYSSPKYLSCGEYWPGRKHPLIQHMNGLRDTPRVHTRLKLITGNYILQNNRASEVIKNYHAQLI